MAWGHKIVLISFKRRGGSFIEVDADIIEFDGVQMSVELLKTMTEPMPELWFKFARKGDEVTVIQKQNEPPRADCTWVV